MRTSIFESPVGALTLAASDNGLRAVLWPDDRPGRVPLPQTTPTAASRHRVLAAAADQLTEYFEGGRRQFDLALDLHGTPFSVQTWQALADISYGDTLTYGSLANLLGRPGAARAVGAAVGRNPVSIILPCHRVLGADGALTGFAGGTGTKRWLLDHERRVADAE
ncbi:MAG: methylated-DNA--[protein]-cysteine S-methyltransferase [Acidimicrobiales bacterium]